MYGYPGIIMKFGTLVVAVTALSVSSAAQADWQYTKWAMSPDQVIAASKGAVAAVDPTKDAEMPWGIKEAVGTFSSNGREMKASFWFKDHKLTQVNLSSNSESDCVSIANDLNGIYGPPSDRPTGSSKVWNDSRTGNRILLRGWGSQGCDLIYSQLATSATTGL